MLTDWLIWLDLLEDNNFNTSFLRFVTAVIIPKHLTQNCLYVKNLFLPNSKTNKPNITYDDILYNFSHFNENDDINENSGNGYGYIDLYNEEE